MKALPYPFIFKPQEFKWQIIHFFRRFFIARSMYSFTIDQGLREHGVTITRKMIKVKPGVPDKDIVDVINLARINFELAFMEAVEKRKKFMMFYYVRKKEVKK